MEAWPLFEDDDDDRDVSSEIECGGDNGHDSKKCDEPLDSMDSLQQFLPIRRGISKFYDGKSKSYTNLVEAGCSVSVKDIAKAENGYSRRRRNLILDKTRNFPPRSNSGGGITKRSISSCRNVAALAFAISYDSTTSSSSCATDDSSSISNPMSPSPNHVHETFSTCQSFSSLDIQNCVTSQSGQDVADKPMLDTRNSTAEIYK